LECYFSSEDGGRAAGLRMSGIERRRLQRRLERIQSDGATKTTAAAVITPVATQPVGALAIYDNVATILGDLDHVLGLRE
jgi:hypothetical protein